MATSSQVTPQNFKSNSLQDPIKALQGGGLLIKTYGCQMNEYDSERMANLLENTHGLRMVDEAEEADVLVLNTCSIRERAQEKVFDELGRWKKWKAEKPHRIIAVGGCVASQEGETIRKRAHYVDVIFGPQTLHRLPNMINESLAERFGKGKAKAVIDISFPEIEKFDNLPEQSSSGVSAFVSIMEGCSKYCTFCVVPYTRGEEVSRPFEDVLRDARVLAAQGVREINLLGQNVNAYRGEMADGEIADLSILMHAIRNIEGIDRIRYTTSHPNEMTSSIINAFGEIPELVSHLHLPVQSGSDRILALMKRNHLVLEYKSIIRRVRELRPNLSLSGDFIIGFPGETEEDFRATMKLIEDLKYDRSFSFIYSPRPGTPAASLPDDVSMDVKKQRLYELQELLNEQTNAFSEAMIGTTQRVLVERLSRRSTSQVSGRTENNRVVNFEGDLDMIGTFVDVKIEEALTNSLRGTLVGTPEAGLNLKTSAYYSL